MIGLSELFLLFLVLLFVYVLGVVRGRAEARLKRAGKGKAD